MGVGDTTRRATMRDVAERCGVSVQTVSRVVNDHPSVAPATRERILAAVADLRYTPSAMAKSLHSGRTGTVGVLVSALEHTGPSMTLLGIAKECADRGLAALLSDLPVGRDGGAEAVIDRMRSHHVDGIVVAVPMVGGSIEPLLDAVGPTEVPVVFVRAGDLDRRVSVTVDNATAIDEVVDHLVALGRRRIAHISGPLNWYEARVRADQWRIALERHGLPAPDEAMVEGNWDADVGAHAMGALLDAVPDLDAVVVANDRMAFGALSALRARGVRVPDDVAVTGFDDVHEAPWAHPPLTSVAQPLVELGRRAVSTVLDPRTQSGESTTILIPCRLVVRESTIGPSASR